MKIANFLYMLPVVLLLSIIVFAKPEPQKSISQRQAEMERMTNAISTKHQVVVNYNSGGCRDCHTIKDNTFSTPIFTCGKCHSPSLGKLENSPWHQKDMLQKICTKCHSIKGKEF